MIVETPRYSSRPARTGASAHRFRLDPLEARRPVPVGARAGIDWRIASAAPGPGGAPDASCSLVAAAGRPEPAQPEPAARQRAGEFVPSAGRTEAS